MVDPKRSADQSPRRGAIGVQSDKIAKQMPAGLETMEQ
jgi:hypothetical protein